MAGLLSRLRKKPSEVRCSALVVAAGSARRMEGIDKVLAPLGELLGRYDGPAQRDGVAAVRARLEELADRAQADCRRQGRVYRALGLSGGAFLVILLL